MKLKHVVKMCLYFVLSVAGVLNKLKLINFGICNRMKGTKDMEV